MTNKEKAALAIAWIHGQAGGTGSKAEKQSWRAIQTIMDLPWNHPTLAWEMVQRIHETIETEIRSTLAAGPLEDLMKRHGKRFIGRVEKLAKKDSRFRDLMKGVWLSRDVPEWKRFYKAAGIPQPKHMRRTKNERSGT